MQSGSFQVPTTGVEGGVATFRVTASDAAPGLTYSWRVEGPARAVSTLTGAVVTYTWPDDGKYKGSVTIADAGGAAVTIGPVSVAVANLAPTIATAVAPATSTEGQAPTLTASATDPACARTTRFSTGGS